MSDVTGIFPIPSPGVPLYFGEVGRPLVVVVHDWYGRLPWLEPFAEAIASDGFRVAVPDLYRGFATIDADDAADLMAALDVGTALAEIDDVISTARAEGTERVGLVGFSLGGWLALLHAQSGAADAVIAYYATLDEKSHGVIPCPVLLQFAEIDEWGDTEDPESFVGRLKDHGTPVSQHSYAGTQHSFANASIKDRVDARSAQLAFHRNTLFLREHLRD